MRVALPAGPWADAAAARQRRESGVEEADAPEWRSKDTDKIMAYQREQRWTISGLVMAEILEDAFCALTFGSGAIPESGEARERAASGSARNKGKGGTARGGTGLIVL